MSYDTEMTNSVQQPFPILDVRGRRKKAKKDPGGKVSKTTSGCLISF